MVRHIKKMNELTQAAVKFRARARAPYSGYYVGAAVQAKDGTIIGGCNVENASYSLSCCAERVALFNAISQGYSDFVGLAVATKNGASPCGACRQVIWELCGEIKIYLCDEQGNVTETTSQTLLPSAFDTRHLE